MSPNVRVRDGAALRDVSTIARGVVTMGVGVVGIGIDAVRTDIDVAALGWYCTANRLVRSHARHVTRHTRAAGGCVGRVVGVARAAVRVAHGAGA